MKKAGVSGIKLQTNVVSFWYIKGTMENPFKKINEVLWRLPAIKMVSIPHATWIWKWEFSFVSSGRPKTLSSGTYWAPTVCWTPCQLPPPCSVSEALLLVAFIEGGKLQLREVKKFPPGHTTSLRFKPGPSESDSHVLSTILHLGLLWPLPKSNV